jgi:hypothetical protein
LPDEDKDAIGRYDNYWDIDFGDKFVNPTNLSYGPIALPSKPVKPPTTE